MQIYGIFTEYPWKIMENMRKIIPFLSISFLNLLPDEPFSRSFLEKIGEFRRKMENIGDIFPFSFIFFPLHYTFIPQPLDFLPQMLNLTIRNKKVTETFGSL